MIGNSSSGIMEAASFALPVVNVGMRQQGRERARNVIDAPAEQPQSKPPSTAPSARISETRSRGMENPYGNGTAAKTIAHVLTTVPSEGLLIKQPTPIA
jgi:UDP-N-acetylglucosamine 2-epimerase